MLMLRCFKNWTLVSLDLALDNSICCYELEQIPEGKAQGKSKKLSQRNFFSSDLIFYELIVIFHIFGDSLICYALFFLLS